MEQFVQLPTDSPSSSFASSSSGKSEGLSLVAEENDIIDGSSSSSSEEDEREEEYRWFESPFWEDAELENAVKRLEDPEISQSIEASAPISLRLDGEPASELRDRSSSSPLSWDGENDEDDDDDEDEDVDVEEIERHSAGSRTPDTHEKIQSYNSSCTNNSTSVSSSVKTNKGVTLPSSSSSSSSPSSTQRKSDPRAVFDTFSPPNISVDTEILDIYDDDSPTSPSHVLPWDLDIDSLVSKAASRKPVDIAKLKKSIALSKRVWKTQRELWMYYSNTVSSTLGRQSQRLEMMFSKPPVIRTRHKYAFTFGVFGSWLTVYLLCSHRKYIPMYYFFVMLLLVIMRYFSYHRAKFHYFLIDFCYFLQMWLLFYLFFYPTSSHLFQVVFAISNGPISWAITVWRNSLVFHDLDKITSVALHFFPPLVTYQLRWHGAVDHDGFYTICSEPDCRIPWADTMLWPLVFFAFWMCCYFLKVNFTDRRKLTRDPEIVTSIRWMSKPGELLSTLRHANSGLYFAYIQLLYHALCLILVKLMFRSRNFHFWFLVIMMYNSVQNGANFYFESFFFRYLKAVNPNSEVRDRLDEIRKKIRMEKAKERAKKKEMKERRRRDRMERKTEAALTSKTIAPPVPPVPPSPSTFIVTPPTSNPTSPPHTPGGTQTGGTRSSCVTDAAVEYANANESSGAIPVRYYVSTGIVVAAVLVYFGV